MLNAVDNDNAPIVVSIRPDGTGNYQLEEIPANYITSIYGKDNAFLSYITAALDRGHVLYWDKNKGQELFSVLGLQLPQGFNNLAPNVIIHQSQALVKREAEINSGKSQKRPQGISQERRAEILAAFAAKHQISGVFTVQHDRKKDTKDARAYNLVLKTTQGIEMRQRLFTKPNGVVFTDQLLADSLAAFEQSQFFQDFIAKRQQQPFLFSPDELDSAQPETAEPPTDTAVPETDAAEADTNISPTPEQIRAEAAERVAAMSEDEKRELMNYVDGAPVFITFPPDVLAMVELIAAEEQRAFEERLAAAVADESTLEFGLLGNGITVYDKVRMNQDSGDYLTVAHISEESNVQYFAEVSEADRQRIEEEAAQQLAKFTEQWNALSDSAKLERIMDTASPTQVVQIADDSLPLQEKIAKYERSVIFRAEEFPEAPRVHQVITNAGFDGGIDEKQEYQTLGGAIQAGRAYLTDGYLGFAVYNQQTKQIEHVEGNFPLQHSFSPEILRLNGLEAEAAAADQELASSDQPQQVDTSINITDETRTLADAFGVDAADAAAGGCCGLGSTGRESAGDKPESFDGGMLGEGWMRINEPCSVILSLCRA